MEIEIKFKLDDKKELVLTEEQAKEVYTKLGHYFAENTSSSVPVNTSNSWPYYTFSRLLGTTDPYKWKIDVT